MLKVNLNTKSKRNCHNISQFVHINVFETFFCMWYVNLTHLKMKFKVEHFYLIL